MSKNPDWDSENERNQCDKFTRQTWIGQYKIPDQDSENERKQCDKFTQHTWIGMPKIPDQDSENKRTNVTRSHDKLFKFRLVINSRSNDFLYVLYFSCIVPLSLSLSLSIYIYIYIYIIHYKSAVNRQHGYRRGDS